LLLLLLLLLRRRLPGATAGLGTALRHLLLLKQLLLLSSGALDARVGVHRLLPLRLDLLLLGVAVGRPTSLAGSCLRAWPHLCARLTLAAASASATVAHHCPGTSNNVGVVALLLAFTVSGCTGSCFASACAGVNRYLLAGI